MSVRRDRDAVIVIVDDDGVGGARIGAGTGLRGLQDRLGALDGTLSIDSPKGGGTRLRARIPCGADALVAEARDATHRPARPARGRARRRSDGGRSMTTSQAAAVARPPALDTQTMCDALRTTIAHNRDRVALRSPDGAVELTYAALEHALAATASILHAMGLRRGDTLGLMLLNRVEFHVVDAAAMLLGATPFSLYQTSPAEQVAFVLGDAGNRLVVTEPRFEAVVREAAGDGVRVVLLDELTGGDPSFDLDAHAAAVGPSDLLTLIYTSGTTGPPKGVQTTHANMLAELRGMHAAIPLDGGGRQVSFLPSAHIADRWASHYGALMTYANTLTPVPDPATLTPVMARGPPDRVRRRAAGVGEVPRGARGRAGPGSPTPRAPTRPSAPRSARGSASTQAQWLCVGAAPAAGRAARVLRRPRAADLRGLGHERDLVHRHDEPPGPRRASARSACRSPAWSSGSPTTASCSSAARSSWPGYRGRDDLTAEAVDADGWLHTGDVARDRRRRLRLDRRPQEGADHQRGGQEHVAGEHRDAPEGRRPADRPGVRVRRPPPVQRRGARPRPRHGRRPRPGRPRRRRARAGARSTRRTATSRAWSRSSASRLLRRSGCRAATS